MKKLWLLPVVVLLLGVVKSDGLRIPRDEFRIGRLGGRAGVPAAPAVIYPAMAFAPPNGSGMGVECAGVLPVTVPDLSPLTFVRTSASTCIRADGTGVILDAGEPGVSVAPSLDGGALGVWAATRASTNLLLRSYQLTNAAWSATAAVTEDAYAGAFTYYANNHDLEELNDSSGAASQGVSQAVTTAEAAQYALSCWLRSGTATSARLVLTGTGNSAGDRTCTITGLTALPRRYACVSTASYSGGQTAVSADVLVGSASADTGTIGAGDCQLETDTYWGGSGVNPTPYIPTQAAAATRSQEQWILSKDTLNDTAGCLSAGFYRKQWDSEPVEWMDMGDDNGAANVRQYPDFGFTTSNCYDRTNLVSTSGESGAAYNTQQWASCAWSGATMLAANSLGGAGSGDYDGTYLAARFTLGADTAAGVNGTRVWMTNIVGDTTTTGCTTPVSYPVVRRYLWLGDSISAQVPTPATTLAALTGVPTDNNALSGALFISEGGTSNCRVQWIAHGGSGGLAYHEQGVVILCGINDVLADVSGATLWAAYQEFLEKWILERRVNFVPVTLGPFKGHVDWTAGRETAKDDFNTSLMSWCASHPTVPCVDTRGAWNGATPGLAADGDPDTLYAPYDRDGTDHLHLSDTGRAALGTMVKNQAFP